MSPTSSQRQSRVCECSGWIAGERRGSQQSHRSDQPRKWTRTCPENGDASVVDAEEDGDLGLSLPPSSLASSSASASAGSNAIATTLASYHLQSESRASTRSPTASRSRHPPLPCSHHARETADQRNRSRTLECLRSAESGTRWNEDEKADENSAYFWRFAATTTVSVPRRVRTIFQQSAPTQKAPTTLLDEDPSEGCLAVQGARSRARRKSDAARVGLPVWMRKMQGWTEDASKWRQLRRLLNIGRLSGLESREMECEREATS